MQGLIYKIDNDINSYCYVGQTTSSLKHRWDGHKSLVRSKKKTDEFHTIMREFGINHFHIQMIEELLNTTQEELDACEQYWIDYYNSFYEGYNSTKGGRFGARNTDKIVCYTLSGKEYKTYDTIADVAKDLKVNYEQVVACLNNFSQQSCGGYQMKYQNSTKPILDCSKEKINFNKTKILFIQYDLTGHYINHYISSLEASRVTGSLESGIIRCAKGQLKYSNNYIWRYGFLGEEIPQIIEIEPITNTDKGKRRAVIYIDSNGEITNYNSLSEAALKTGYSRHKITYNCDIYPKTTLSNGWFKYEEDKRLL